jgi:pseudoazurin
VHRSSEDPEDLSRYIAQHTQIAQIVAVCCKFLTVHAMDLTQWGIKEKEKYPMFMQKLAIGLAALFIANAGHAETFEILMLNKGETGKMVFEPAYLAVSPGDTVTFVAKTKGHNAETIKGMIPSTAKKFKSKAGKDFSVTLTEEGIYGIKCTPHYAAGMVALLQVGAATNLEGAASVKQRGKAKKRFVPLFEQVK